MITATLKQAALWCRAELHGQDRTFAGVQSDSRALSPGQLFVALPGERVDGHDFVAAAQAAGAAGALVSRSLPLDLPQLRCLDPALALGQLARGWLQRCPALRIGITGSNGKTTVKTLTAQILATTGSTYVNPGNRNNEIGVPLAACEVGMHHRFAVFEMGAGKPGDLAYLAAIAPPQIALVNNIAAAHLERLGSLEGVARTKAALYQALPADGIAVIPADDAQAPLLRQLSAGRRRLEFGLDTRADVHATEVRLDLEGCRFLLHGNGERVEVLLPLAGEHNLRNALAAAAVGVSAGVSLALIAESLTRAQPVHGRLQRIADPRGFVVVDDSYNANPGSFAAGLKAVCQPGQRVWLAMGQMAELGPEGPQMHAQIGALAAELGVERLYAVGELCRHAVAAAGLIGRHFNDQQALSQALESEIEAGVTVLVKGSRSAGMERVVAGLRRGVASC